MDFSSLKSCTELRDVHITEAVQSSEAMSALLDRFVALAGPNKGAPVILAALARLGTTACDWIDGELRIELVAQGDRTKVICSSSIGGGFREKPFPEKVLAAPLAEFSRMISRVPKLIEPLVVKETESRIVLSVAADVRKTTVPPTVAIGDASLLSVPKIPAAPAPALAVRPKPAAATAPRPAAPAPPRPGAPGAAAAPAPPKPTPGPVPALALRPKPAAPALPVAPEEKKIVLRRRGQPPE